MQCDEQSQALLSAPAETEGPSPADTKAYLTDFATKWHKASAYGPASEQADMLHAIYQRVEVVAPGNS